MTVSIKTLCIMGPTASGKSALALALAERLGAEIVNADSMQVYRDLRVLTARPSPEDEARAPHALYGAVDAAVRYSAGRWLKDAVAAITAIHARGRLALVVGGTGLYFKALTEGLAPTPPIPGSVRADLADELARAGAAALHQRLRSVDPEAAERIKPADAPRILRALEVFEATGAPLSALQRAAQPAIPDGAWRGLALMPERAGLYARIEARFAAMLAGGALEEVRALAARGLDPALPAMKAHGAPHLIAHLRGEIGLAEAAALAARDTRQYAKRQFTWIAHQMPAWPRLPAAAPTEALEAALRLIEMRAFKIT